MSGHGCGRVVQNDQDHIRLIVHGIDNTCDRRGEEGRVSDKRKACGVRLHFFDTLCDIQSGTHTQTGINHIERKGISERITSDIPAENGFLSFHSFFYGVERSSVRTSGAKYRRADRQCRRFRKISGDRGGKTKKCINIGSYSVTGVFSGTGSMTTEFSVNSGWKMIFSAYIDQLTFDDRIKFFQAENFIKSRKEIYC